MGLDDVLKKQIRDRAPEVKQRLVQEFKDLTHDDMQQTGDDPDEIVDKVQQKTGQPREQIEKRVHELSQQQ